MGFPLPPTYINPSQPPRGARSQQSPTAAAGMTKEVLEQFQYGSYFETTRGAVRWSCGGPLLPQYDAFKCATIWGCPLMVVSIVYRKNQLFMDKSVFTLGGEPPRSFSELFSSGLVHGSVLVDICYGVCPGCIPRCFWIKQL